MTATTTGHDLSNVAAIIQGAFGPCTTLYEAYEPEELVEALQESSSILGFVQGQFDAEVIWAERGGYHLEDPKQHARHFQAANQYLSAIHGRLTEAGFHLEPLRPFEVSEAALALPTCLCLTTAAEDLDGFTCPRHG